MNEKEKREKYSPKAGEDLKSSTIFVITLGLLILGIMIYFSVQTKSTVLVIVGVVFLLICILCTLPNLIKFFRGKWREHLIKAGKLVEAPKKSYNPNSRFDDNE